MSQKGKVRQMISALEAECPRIGIEWLGVDSTGGKHIRGLVRIDGKERFIILPRSPSDTDCIRIKIGDLKRLVREMRQA